MYIAINISNKHALVQGTPSIVCGNDSYIINFTFDEEWTGQEYKTARFVYVQDGEVKYTDVVFTGTLVEVPPLLNTREVMVGVYAGDLQTSTPARIPCEPSIRCGTGAPEDPTPSQYDQIMELLNAGGSGGGGGESFAVQYIQQSLTEEQKEQARQNLGGVLTGADIAAGVTLYGGTEIDGGDLDDYITEGNYYIQSNDNMKKVAHVPNANAGVLKVLSGLGGKSNIYGEWKYLVQIFITHNCEMFIRHYYKGSWCLWKQFAGDGSHATSADSATTATKLSPQKKYLTVENLKLDGGYIYISLEAGKTYIFEMHLDVLEFSHTFVLTVNSDGRTSMSSISRYVEVSGSSLNDGEMWLEYSPGINSHLIVRARNISGAWTTTTAKAEISYIELG